MINNPAVGRNPLMLYRTTNQQASKMDFYQYYDTDGKYAWTSCFKKNSSGSYYAMPLNELDLYDWVYAEVHINDRYMGDANPSYSALSKQVTVLHEMLHGYGLKDLRDVSNRSSVMYGYADRTATGITDDANSVLIAKYTY
jgi:hypothetical protein